MRKQSSCPKAAVFFLAALVIGQQVDAPHGRAGAAGNRSMARMLASSSLTPATRGMRTWMGLPRPARSAEVFQDQPIGRSDEFLVARRRP